MVISGFVSLLPSFVTGFLFFFFLILAADGAKSCLSLHHARL